MKKTLETMVKGFNAALTAENKAAGLAPQVIAEYHAALTAAGNADKAAILAAIESDCRADATWPEKDGQKVGQKAARQSAAGRAYNCCAAYADKYVNADGSVMTELERKAANAKKAADKAQKAVDADKAATAEKEAAVIAAKKAVIDGLTDATIFDILASRYGTDKKAATTITTLFCQHIGLK